MDFQLAKGDISQINVDAIVISVTKELKCEGSLSKKIIKIENKSSKKAILESDNLLEFGKVVCIGANIIPAKYIILAVVPKWIDGYHDEYLLLDTVYKNALSLAEKMKCKSIAFPILGIGRQNFKANVAFERASHAIHNFSSKKLKKVIIVDERETVIAPIRDMGFQVEDLSKEQYSDRSLEQLFSATDSFSTLTKVELDEVYTTVKEIDNQATDHLNFGRAFSAKTIVFQRTLFDFKIEKTKKHLCRIKKIIGNEHPAYCKEERLYFLLKNKMVEKKQLSALDSKEYGLVLCGGGAKGAYQIGACKALYELTNIRFTGIAGTSVGALNSLLIAQGDYKKAEDVWLNVTQKDLTELNKWLKTIGSILSLLGHSISNSDKMLLVLDILNIVEPISLISLSKGNDEISKQKKTLSIFKNKLDLIISNAIYNWESIDSGKIVYACSSTGLIKHFSHAEYFPLVEMSHEEIKNVVMSSAAFPLAYSKISINGKQYNDGGVNNNAPYDVLVDNGFKNIIVIHLSSKDRDIDKYSANTYKSVKLYHIYPSSDLGGLFKISESLTKDRMKKGYEDVRNWLNNVKLKE